MLKDPAEDIIKILYNPFAGKLYSIIKFQKRIKEPELKSKIDKNEIDELDKNLKVLLTQGFIEIIQIDIPPVPNMPKRPKGANKVNEIIFNERFDFNTFKERYEFLKENINKDLKRQEEEKYECKNCGDKYVENIASRIKFTCTKCKIKLEQINTDASDLKEKCKKIFDLLDNRFKQKLNNLSLGRSSDYYNYLTAKYGNNVLNSNNINKVEVFEEENEPYIANFLERLDRENNEQEKFNFYELTEAYKRYKNK